MAEGEQDDLKPVIGRYRVSSQDADAELAKNSVRARLFGGKKKKTRLGKYVLGKLIGVGGMGRVYVAHDRELDRKVALKLLKGSQWAGEEVRLWREARTLAQINHRNVVSVYEVGEAQMGVFVAMEFIDGRTLRQWVNDEDPPPKAVIEVLREAGRGLVAAHGAGIVHRDFKPDNVLIGKDGRVCVVDFGIAQDVAELGHAIRPEDYGTATGRERLLTSGPAGTPAYMAPERIDGRDADVSGDIYSFCASTWEALTGQLPDPYTNTPPPDVRRVIPSGLRKALIKGLDHRPTKRQPSMRILLDAFDQVLHRGQRSRLLWAGGGVLLAGAAVGALLHAPANVPVRSKTADTPPSATDSQGIPTRPLGQRLGLNTTLAESSDASPPLALLRLSIEPTELLRQPSVLAGVEPAFAPTLEGHDADATLARWFAQNVDVVPTLVHAYAADNLPADDPMAWQAHAQLLHAIAGRYDQAQVVGHGFAGADADRLTPPEFAAMASAAYDGHRGALPQGGIKTANPNARVLLDAIGHDMTRTDMWSARVIDYLDGVRAWSSAHREASFPADTLGLHVPTSDSEHLEAIVQWRDTHLPDRELWVTSIAPQAQEPHVIRSALRILAVGVDRVLIGPDVEQNAVSTSPMLAVLLDRLGSFTLEDALEGLPPDVWALRFRGPDARRALVVWRETTDGGVTRGVSLKIPSATASVRVLGGEVREVEASDGLHLDVLETPTIVEYDD